MLVLCPTGVHGKGLKLYNTVNISCNYCNFFGITQSPLNTVKKWMLGTLPLSPVRQLCVYVWYSFRVSTFPTDFCASACLAQLLKKQTYLPKRDPGGDLLIAVDHCFSIRGQGTVMTGTVLQGSLAVNDTVEIPALKVGCTKPCQRSELGACLKACNASVIRIQIFLGIWSSEDVSSMLGEDKGISHVWWGLTSFELGNLNQVYIIRHAQ